MFERERETERDRERESVTNSKYRSETEGKREARGEGSLLIVLEELEKGIPRALVVGQVGDEDIEAVAAHFRTHY